MNPKQLYFVLATTATVSAVAGALGADVVFSDAPLNTYTQQSSFEDIVRPTPLSIVSQVESQIQNAVCPKINAKHGAGTCQPTTMDYDIVHSRSRGETRSVGRFPAFNVDNIDRTTPPALVTQLQNQIDSTFCPVIDARYGVGICNKETIDYTVRHVRTSGQTRTVVRFDFPVLCTQPAPIDPNAPEPEIP